MAIPASCYSKQALFLTGLLFTLIFLFTLNVDCSSLVEVFTFSRHILNRDFGCSTPAQLWSVDKSEITSTFAQYTPEPLSWGSISRLAKRDVCTDALPGSVSSSCTPSNTSTTTLCCVRPDSVYPTCSVLLGVGFCCVSTAGDCYTDTASVCFTDPDPVRCQTTAGVNVCCPQHTTCASGYNHKEGSVRCLINSISLSSVLASSTSSSETTSTSKSASTSITAVAADTTSTTATGTSVLDVTSLSTLESTPSTRVSESQGLSGGTIAGIALGSTATIATAFLAALLILRRRKHKTAFPESNIPTNSHAFNPTAGIYPKQELDAQGYNHPNNSELYGQKNVHQDLLGPPSELEAVDSVRGRIKRT